MTEDRQKTIASAKLREHLKRETDAEASEDAAMYVDEDVAEVVGFLDSVSESFRRSSTRATISHRQGNEFVRKVVADGNVSGMQHVAGYVDNRMSQKEAIPYLVDQLRVGGSTVYLWGSQGSGKTHTSLWFVDLVDKFVDDIAATITNVPVDDVHVDVSISQSSKVRVELDGEPVDRLEALCGVDRSRVSLVVDGRDVTDELVDADMIHVGREWHARAASAVVPCRSVVLVDEWGTKGGGNKGSNPHAGEEMIQFLKEIRHEPYRSTCICIGHSPTDLEKDGRVVLDIGVKKVSKTVGRIYRKVMSDGGDDLVTDVEIGAHGLSYNDEGATPWVFEGDVADGDDEETVDPDEVESEVLRRVAQDMRDAGVPVKSSDPKETTICDLVGRSDTWVYEVTDG